MKAGDRCPQCKGGLLERTEMGLSCDNCSFEKEIEEVVAENSRTRDAGFRPASIKIRIDDPDEGEVFLQGLIVARSNNSSPLFEELIDGVNAILEPARAARLQSEVAARG